MRAAKRLALISKLKTPEKRAFQTGEKQFSQRFRLIVGSRILKVLPWIFRSVITVCEFETRLLIGLILLFFFISSWGEIRVANRECNQRGKPPPILVRKPNTWTPHIFNDFLYVRRICRPGAVTYWSSCTAGSRTDRESDPPGTPRSWRSFPCPLAPRTWIHSGMTFASPREHRGGGRIKHLLWSIR